MVTLVPEPIRLAIPLIFTAKPLGMGLGLATSRTIVEKIRAARCVLLVVVVSAVPGAAAAAPCTIRPLAASIMGWTVSIASARLSG